MLHPNANFYFMEKELLYIERQKPLWLRIVAAFFFTISAVSIIYFFYTMDFSIEENHFYAHFDLLELVFLLLFFAIYFSYTINCHFDFTKKLLGRIVFLHFLQKKGWMGCNPDFKDWQQGNKQFMQHFFEAAENKETLGEVFGAFNRMEVSDMAPANLMPYHPGALRYYAEAGITVGE
mgnify:CR=1 FL=1